MWTLACQLEPLMICRGREQVGHGRVESTGTPPLPRHPPIPPTPSLKPPLGQTAGSYGGVKTDGEGSWTCVDDRMLYEPADVSVFCF